MDDADKGDESEEAFNARRGRRFAGGDVIDDSGFMEGESLQLGAQEAPVASAQDPGLEEGGSHVDTSAPSEGEGQSRPRSSVELDEEAEEDDFESDKEPTEEEKFEEMGHKSFRDFEIERDRERHLQMHMNRTDNLLYSVFPKHVAEALRQGKKVEPENHECVTIFFSDIVGFTDISSRLDPLKISDLLDRLYNSFDTLSHYHDVFKVETIVSSGSCGSPTQAISDDQSYFLFCSLLNFERETLTWQSPT